MWIMYLEGLGTPNNFDTALDDWFQKSIFGGKEEAKIYIEKLDALDLQGTKNGESISRRMMQEPKRIELQY